MREIKFRAWDSKNEKMIVQGNAIDENRTVFWSSWENKKHVSAPMQYTGLKDKNGREIYEGDVLKETYPAGYSLHTVKFGIYDNGLGYEDNISGYGWYVETYRPWDSSDSIQIWDYLGMRGEVIGNIYENPELLNDPSN